MSGLEIERKFRVVSDDYKTMAFAHSRIKQGYISSRQGVTEVPLMYNSVRLQVDRRTQPSTPG